jgi:hypothetical protein
MTGIEDEEKPGGGWAEEYADDSKPAPKSQPSGLVAARNVATAITTAAGVCAAGLIGHSPVELISVYLVVLMLTPMMALALMRFWPDLYGVFPLKASGLVCPAAAVDHAIGRSASDWFPQLGREGVRPERRGGDPGPCVRRATHRRGGSGQHRSGPVSAAEVRGPGNGPSRGAKYLSGARVYLLSGSCGRATVQEADAWSSRFRIDVPVREAIWLGVYPAACGSAACPVVRAAGLRIRGAAGRGLPAASMTAGFCSQGAATIFRLPRVGARVPRGRSKAAGSKLEGPTSNSNEGS